MSAETIKKVRELIKSNKLGEARLICEKLIENNSNSTESNFLLGHIYFQLKSYDRAEEYLEKTLFINPNYYEALVDMSLLCEKMQRHNEALLYRERSFRVAHRNESE